MIKTNPDFHIHATKKYISKLFREFAKAKGWNIVHIKDLITEHQKKEKYESKAINLTEIWKPK